jgi:hypothetical protein
MKTSNKHDELIDRIYDIISPYFKDIFIEKRNGIGYIQIFDEHELVKGKRNRFKIAYADMMVLDEEEKPFLVIEAEMSSSPKTFGRSIPTAIYCNLTPQDTSDVLRGDEITGRATRRRTNDRKKFWLCRFRLYTALDAVDRSLWGCWVDVLKPYKVHNDANDSLKLNG